MKNFNFHLTTSDTKTLIATLTVLPEVLPQIEGILPENFNRALFFSETALKKLSNMETRISKNELAAIHLSLCLADMVNRDEVIVDQFVSQLCREHVFGINKLKPLYDELFGK